MLEQVVEHGHRVAAVEKEEYFGLEQVKEIKLAVVGLETYHEIDVDASLDIAEHDAENGVEAHLEDACS